MIRLIIATNIPSVTCLFQFLFVVFYLNFEQREKRTHLRKAAASYEADQVTLQRLSTLDGSKPPLLIINNVKDRPPDETPLQSSPKENENKTSQLRHCLISACAQRDGPGISKVRCKVVVRTNSFWKNLRERMRDITTHSAFDVVIVVLILLNTIVLAMYHHGIDPKFRQVLDYVNLVSRLGIPGLKSSIFFIIRRNLWP